MADYKYKLKPPKAPTFELPTLDIFESEEEKAIKSLESQKANLETRLAAQEKVDNRNLIEKALNLPEDQGFLMDFADIIDRPFQAVGQALTAVLDKDADTTLAKSFWEGLSGQEKMEFTDMLDDIGVETDEWSEARKFLVNIVGSMALDPFTYIPAGFFAKMFIGNKGVKTSAILKQLDDGFKASNKMLSNASMDEVLEMAAKLDIDIQDAKTFREGFELSTKSDNILYDPQISKAAGGAEELTVTYQLSEALRGMDDVVIKHSKPSNRVADLSIYKKTKINGEDAYILVEKLEVKDALKGAFGSGSMTLKVVNGALEFTGKNFNKLSSAMQKKLIKAVNTLATSADDLGVPLTDVVQAMQKAGVEKRSFAFTDDFLKQELKLDDETITSFQELLGEVMSQVGDGYYGFTDADGILRILSGEEFLKNIDVNGRIMHSAAGKVKKDGTKTLQTRLFSNVKLKKDLDMMGIDQTTDFLADLGKKVGDISEDATKKGLIINILGKIPAMEKPLELLEKATFHIGQAFSYGYKTSSKFKRQMARIGGESANMLQRNSKRLAKVANSLSSVADDGLKQAQNIIEAGLTLGEKGFEYTSRTHSLGDLIESMKALSKKGDAMPVYRMTDIQADNVLANLNDSVATLTGSNNTFKIVKKGDDFAIYLDDVDFDAFKKLQLDDMTASKSIDFGRQQADEALEKFYSDNYANIDELRSIQDEMREVLIKELGYDALDDVLKQGNGYARHVLTKQGKELLKKSRPAAMSPHVKAGVDALQARKFIGSAEEINSGLKTFYNMDIDFFDTNIQNSIDDLIHITSTKYEQGKVLKTILQSQDEAGKPLFKVIDNVIDAKEELGYQFEVFTSMDDEFGAMMKNMSPSAKKAFDDELAKLGFKKGDKAIGLHKSAYDMIKQVNRAYIELNDFVKGYDKFLTAWKSVTLLSPGFHMRNLFGNMTNSYLAGMSLPSQLKHYRRASLDLNKYDEILELVLDNGVESLSKADKAIYNRVTDFLESGVSQTHKGVRDLESVKKLLEEGREGIAIKAVNLNFTLSEKMDDMQRYMLYQWGYDEGVKKFGKDILDKKLLKQKARSYAMDKTSSALFDYNHLTSFEKDYMKRLFPFYTFMKNNLVFQMKNVVDNPKAYARTMRAYTSYIDSFEGIAEEDMPDYMTDNMWLPIPLSLTKGDSEAISFLKLNLPISDFTEIIDNPLKKGVTSVTAPIKLAFEIAANRDIFTGRPIKDFPGEKKRMAEDEGVAAWVRDPQGTPQFSADPVIDRFLDDAGLRVPANYVGMLADIADTALGYQDFEDMVGDLLSRGGLTKTIAIKDLELTELYEDIENLRNQKSLWEQEKGISLPTLADLGLG